MTRNIWTREELVLAFNLYLKLPFGKMHSRTPEVVHLAKLINRTPDSIAIRLTNFAHIDPYHQERGIKGMSGGKKQVEPIWNEFINDKEKLIFESECILAEKENLTIETKFKDVLEKIKELKGETKLREIKTRINQNYFRQIIIANYSGKCAISGINIPDLLFASHIVPWSINENERLNPENGICLSPLYDKAFDKGYIGIKENYEIIISSELRAKQNENYYTNYFSHLEKKKIKATKKYNPKKEFLQYHLDTIFKGQ